MRRLPRKLKIGLLMAALFAIFVNIPGKPSDPDFDKWRSGDIIFLNGTSIRSKIVRLLQGYSVDYSHVGIILLDEGIPYVIHADPAEGKVVKQRWEFIVATGQVSGGAVYKVLSSSPATVQTVCEMAEIYAAKGVPFDNDFDLKTEDRVFCTEMVLLAYRRGGVDICENAETEHPRLLPAHLLNAKLERTDRF